MVLRFMLNRPSVRRLAHGVPVVGLLLVAEVALVAKDHLVKLNGAQRRRLIALLLQSRGRPGSLAEADRLELGVLFATMEPRLFMGSAVKRLSPVPVPSRLLYGPRDSAARTAASRRS